MAVGRSPGLAITEFGGGLNMRDAPNRIRPNETPDAVNWTLDNLRGQPRFRRGLLNAASLPGVSGTNANIFYSAVLDQWLCIRETAGAPNSLHLHTRPGNLTGVWTDRGAVATATTALNGFADWPGTTPYVVLGAFKEVYTWDGTTLTLRSTGLVGAAAFCPWENRMWAIGYPTNDASGTPALLCGSKIGDPTTWAPPDGLQVQIRDINPASAQGLPLTALGVAGGALVVFKQGSAHRVSDVLSGAYQTIDPASGARTRLSLVSAKGRLVTWGMDGIYAWTGIGHGVSVGDKARPLLVNNEGHLAGALLPGGLVEDRVIFAYPSVAANLSDSFLEYDPQQGWLMKHQIATGLNAGITSVARKGSDLYAADSQRNVMYRINGTAVAGADDGSPYTGVGGNYYTTPWLELAGGKVARIRRAIVEGLVAQGLTNTLSVDVLTDWIPNVASSFDLSADLRDATGTQPERTAILQGLAHGRAHMLRFYAGTAAGDASLSGLTIDGELLEV